MLRLALVPAALVFIAGCASPPPPPVAQAADGTQVAAADPNERKQVCVREQPIGSATMQTKCHYEEDGVRKAMDMDAFRNQVNQATRPRVPSASGS